MGRGDDSRQQLGAQPGWNHPERVMEVTLYTNTEAQFNELLLSDIHGSCVVIRKIEMERLHLKLRSHPGVKILNHRQLLFGKESIQVRSEVKQRVLR